MKTFQKDPSERLPYQWDWSDWLGYGDILTAYTLTFPAGITNDGSSMTDYVVDCWIKDGTADNDYTIVCNVQTALGKVGERSIIIQCAEL